MNEENLQLLKVVGSKEPEYIVALVEGGGDISSLGKIVEAPFGGWIYYFPAHAAWHLSLEIGNLLQITEWVSNLNKYGSPEMFSEEDVNAVPCAESDEPNYPTRDLDTTRPYWANWLARDQDGRWHWFEYRPEWSSNSEEWFVAKDVPHLSKGVEPAGFTPNSGTPAEYSIYFVGTHPQGYEDNE